MKAIEQPYELATPGLNKAGIAPPAQALEEKKQVTKLHVYSLR